MLELKVTNQDIKLTQVTPLGSPLVSGSAGEYECQFMFDETWDGFIKTAIFSIKESGCEWKPIASDGQLLIDDRCIIPAKVLRPNAKLRIGIFGSKGEIKRPTVYTSPMLVRQGADIEGSIPDPEPSIYLQLIELIEKVGVPTGGKEGQVLAKKSDNDYDTHWVDQTGGGGTITAVGEGDMIIITTSLSVRGEGDTIIIG